MAGAKFGWQRQGKDSMKKDEPTGGTCSCGHHELAHEYIAGFAIGKCLHRGCKCKALEVAA